MKDGSIASFRAAAEQPDPEPPRRGVGPACTQCGRFVALSTIQWTPQDDVDQGTPEATGVCRRHGRGEVTVS